MHTNRPYKSDIDYKVYWEKSTKSDIGYNVYQYTTKDYKSQTQTTKFTNRLQRLHKSWTQTTEFTDALAYCY